MSDIVSFLRWWVIISVFGLVTLPLLFRVMRFLPDRGYSLSKTAGLLAVGYAGWLLGNFGFVTITGGGVIIALVVVGFASGVALRGETWNEIKTWFARNWRVTLLIELLFLVAFGFWAYVRALNPNITATEKPMEFAFLNSVIRTQTLPPGDPWLTGYAISYYHFGYIIVAMLTVLSGVLPSVAFNLAIALLFGLTVVGAFGVVFNLIAAVQNKLSLVQSVLPALLGSLLVLLGNFNGALEVAHQTGLLAVTPEQAQVFNACPPEARYCMICKEKPAACTQLENSFWSWLDIKWTNNPPVLGQATNSMPDRFLWWWQSSRVIHDRDLRGNEVEVIDEFPFFSFLLGDMHPHVLSLPFVFLALGFAFNLFLTIREGPTGAAESSRDKWVPLPWPQLAAGALILGGLSFLNTWDFPIYLFVVMASYAVARSLRGGWTQDLWRDAAVIAVEMAALGVVLYLPFYIGFRSQLGGILPNPIFGSRVQQFAVMFGILVVLNIGWLGWLSVQRRKELDWRGGFSLATALLITLLAMCVVFTSALALNLTLEAQNAIVALVGEGSLADVLSAATVRRMALESWLTPVLLTLLIGTTLANLFVRKPKVEAEALATTEAQASSLHLDIALFGVILVLTGGLLTLGPEFVYLRDLFGARMNTIFKFYYQAWVLWSVAGAFGAWLIMRYAPGVVAAVFGLVAAVFVLSGLVYPVLATATITDDWRGTVRDAEGKPYVTLDGMAYMQTVRVADYAAINFLNARVTGRPVIAEAVGGSYTEFARVSVHTGLPTVIGWPFHEFQWRGSMDTFAAREGEVRQLYQARTYNEVKPILDKYNIRYVYVGPMETATYGPEGLAKFAQAMKLIYNDQGVAIYERADK